MKYLIVVPDGAGDDPVKELDGKTPLEVADIPCIDALAARGEVGTCRTVPEGISPGSDSANLSVMGYDPREYDDFIIKDHSAGDITTEEADQLIECIREAFSKENISFYTGTQYRHCMIIGEGDIECSFTPPHDVLERRAGDYLPKGRDEKFFTDMMRKSYEILKDHPVNKSRRERGLNPANSIWIWGQGTRPALPNFNKKYGVEGSVISAVDLIKGIGIFAGLEVIEVQGATGNIDTNFEGKAEAAIDAYKRGKNFVYIHMEGTDECSHQGDLQGKIRCAEYIDSRAVRPIVDYLRGTGERFKVLVVPDHRTPLSIRTHSSDPVSYVIYDSGDEKPLDESRQFNERSAYAAGNHFEDGYKMTDYFFGK